MELSAAEQGRYFWNPTLRSDIVGIKDVRLHDIRHRIVSHAVRQGIPLPVVSRLLSHKHPSMMLRYDHVGDHETAVVEQIGATIARAISVRLVQTEPIIQERLAH